MLELPEGEDEEEGEPNPWPGEAGFLGSEAGSGVGFWDLIENLSFGDMEWRCW